MTSVLLQYLNINRGSIKVHSFMSHQEVSLMISVLWNLCFQLELLGGYFYYFSMAIDSTVWLQTFTHKTQDMYTILYLFFWQLNSPLALLCQSCEVSPLEIPDCTGHYVFHWSPIWQLTPGGIASIWGLQEECKENMSLLLISDSLRQRKLMLPGEAISYVYTEDWNNVQQTQSLRKRETKSKNRSDLRHSRPKSPLP